MCRWLQFQLSGNPLLAELHRQQIAIDDRPRYSGYGLGWFVGDYRGSPLVEHYGSIDSLYARVSLLPEEKIGIVILTEGDRAICDQLGDRLLAALQGGGEEAIGTIGAWVEAERLAL